MSEHVDLWVVFIWPAITGVLNIILRTRSPEAWVELNDRSPRRAAFTRLLRATGFDPVKMVAAVAEFVQGGRR